MKPYDASEFIPMVGRLGLLESGRYKNGNI